MQKPSLHAAATFAVTAFFASLAAFTSGCASHDDATAPAVDAAIPPALCATDSRAQSFTPGLAESGKIGFKSMLLTMSPAPAAKGDNTWDVQIVDKNGANVDGATVTVKTWMPDHGHSSSIIPLVTPTGGGKYTVSRLNLFMPGIWQITLNVTMPGNVVDSMMYTFCVGG